MKVFIADDSEVVCERLTTILSDVPGVEIIGQAGCTAEAIDSIHQLHPDAVILDIRMPGGSGIEVLKGIKKDNSSLLVIMLTNYPYPQYRKTCMTLGADFFFDKSTQFEEVVAVLRKSIQPR